MSAWTYVVGWTLIHFVWQGAVLAAVAAAALQLARRRSPTVRYVIGCAVLAAMLASPVMTARALMTPDGPPGSMARPAQTLPLAGVLEGATGTWLHDEASAVSTVWSSVNAGLPAIVFMWVAGVAMLLVRMAGGLWQVRRLQVHALAADASPWQTAVQRMASRLDVRVAVHVVESALVSTPAAVGWLRPVILLPVAALANLTPSQVEAILAHELVHIRRHDYLVNIGQAVAETLLFFHPAVWWVSAQIRAEREHYCDDVAVQVCGDPVDYAAALAELEAWRSDGTALALAAVDGSLIGRVRRLLRVSAAHEPRSVSWAVTLALTSALAVVAGGMFASSGGTLSGVALDASAQAPEPIASPDTFDWQIHRTNHFDIYYYAALAPRLEEVADAAERAYQRISSELRYDLSFRVPLIPFTTRSDFAQQGMVPDLAELIARGDVKSFSEPRRNRVVILVEPEPARLLRLITHELTHIFAFDIIPRSRDNHGRVPVWIDEGFAEYMTGTWDPIELAGIGKLVAADSIPKIAAVTGTVNGTVADAHLGHAGFDFIEAEFGKAAVWQFLLGVRRSVVDGDANVYQAAFNRTPEEFDSAFSEHLRRRFTP